LRLPISSIDYHQLRLNAESSDLEDLKSSFSRIGQLSAILVRRHHTDQGRYEVIFGNRRLAAARKLGWETIDAQVVESDDLQSLIIAFAENTDRTGFTDYERAIVMKQIHDKSGKSYGEIASLIGKSPAYVSQHIGMLDIFPEGVASAEERERVLYSLSENHARVLSRVTDPTERWNTAKFAIKANLSVRDLEKFCSQSYHKKRASRARDDRNNSVREVIAEIMNGLKSRNLRSVYGPAAKHFTMFSRYPPLYLMDGVEAENHTSNLLHKMKEYDVILRDISVKVLGNFAYATVVRLDKFKTSNRNFKVKTRGTIILAKEDTWKILHEHWSPGDPESLEFFNAEERSPSAMVITKNALPR
jgi:ParB family chromosome partitioning protein